ncbi:hypothetical protein QX233_03065 [Chryseobacterium gambrini]|uniref:Conjugal transfer protein TraD n=2 Tax=Chryseobacterium group TaxID=2782232 RepID=A0AAJ1VIB1_9FLAO|nr:MULTISPECIES: hypothetical protein [Chryseobacterium]MDN4011435.1 hypothetical protein [Chryseobacterium gambrini]QWA38202.1 hypothetical protein KKI44_20280 [Chryseobacterium sp. ZHDP1]
METLIQTIILFCLIVVIILLLIDKVRFIKPQRKIFRKVEQIAEPDVIGKVTIPEKAKTPVWLANRKKLIEQMLTNKADQGNEDPTRNDLEKEDVSSSNIEEPDETDNIPEDDDRFGQAVSLNELTKVGDLLKQDNLDAAQEKETSDILHKMEGTEFLAMMQQSIDGASQKIARLLDKSLSEKHNVIPKENQNNALDNFNIGDFI